jgi:hypothetical protein
MRIWNFLTRGGVSDRKLFTTLREILKTTHKLILEYYGQRKTQ